MTDADFNSLGPETGLFSIFSSVTADYSSRVVIEEIRVVFEGKHA